MEIERINSYTDSRFPQEVLDQHGAFLVDGLPWAFRPFGAGGGGGAVPLLQRAHYRVL